VSAAARAGGAGGVVSVGLVAAGLSLFSASVVAGVPPEAAALLLLVVTAFALARNVYIT
jgi:hypothetical protein